MAARVLARLRQRARLAVPELARSRQLVPLAVRALARLRLQARLAVPVLARSRQRALPEPVREAAARSARSL
jgi:hypothetical protein